MEDCFAYRNRRCSALTVKKCEGLKCNFYKAQEQYQMDRQKALERILSLDKETQNHINETYYKGKMGGDCNEG